METVWSAIGERVRVARQQRGLRQDDVARRVSLERSVLSKVEAGTRRLSAIELLLLSEALRVPMGWLVREHEERLVSRRQAVDRDSGHEAGSFDLDVALEEWSEGVLQIQGLGLLPEVDTAVYSAATVDEAREAARYLRDRRGWGDAPLGAMADVAAACGLWLWAGDVPSERSDGVSLSLDSGLGAAVLTCRSQPGRRRATAAHELGHHVLEDEYGGGPSVHTSRQERESLLDCFAAELLLPSKALEGVSSPGRTRAGLVRIAGLYRVSWSLAAAQARRTWIDAAAGVDLRTTPTRADFLLEGVEPPVEDLGCGATASSWRQAVVQAYVREEVTAVRAVELARGGLTLADLQHVPRVSGDEPT